MTTSTYREDSSKPLYSRNDVAQHNSAGDLWIIIDQNVYNLSQFLDEHPGGSKIILNAAGTDATKKFRKYHRDAILNRYKARLQVGVLEPSPAKESRSRKFFASLRKMQYQVR